MSHFGATPLDPEVTLPLCFYYFLKDVHSSRRHRHTCLSCILDHWDSQLEKTQIKVDCYLYTLETAMVHLFSFKLINSLSA